ncbi:claspin-like [Euwallacea fornicatus]|uniref:claspin-like n=1 Tax=Euwallacea fornicatus TaxID=995702 RepID=UPI00338F7B16
MNLNCERELIPPKEHDVDLSITTNQPHDALIEQLEVEKSTISNSHTEPCEGTSSFSFTATCDKPLDSDSEKENISNSSIRALSVRKKSRIISNESDSEDEGEIENAYNRRQTSEANALSTKQTLIMNDSDSDLDDSRQNVLSLTNKNSIKKMHKNRVLLDSDSDSEEIAVPSPHDKSFANQAQVEQDSEPIIFTTNSKGEVVPENEVLTQKSRLAMLCDSDSEDDNQVLSEHCESNDEFFNKEKKQSSKKVSKENKTNLESTNDGVPYKMTPKEAAEQRKVIQSESQRMVREKDISLPYHKPKPRSLQEFLSRRPRLSKAAESESSRAPPSVAIKMSNEQLELISKKLKEREIEVKEFYKSESEGSDNDEKETCYVPPVEEKGEEEKASNERCLEDEEIINSGIENVADANPEEPANVEPTETLQQTLIDLTPSCTLISEINESNLEDHNSQNTQTCNLQTDPKGFAHTDLDKEIESFGEASTTFKSQLELLKLANDKPTLSGGPDDVIDLNEGVTKSKEVVELMERFAKHAASKKHHPPQKVKLSVIRVESGGDILKEEVAMNVDSDEEDERIEEKPGVKMQRLRGELHRQMELKKAEIWQQKAAKGIRGDTQDDIDKNILDDDSEEEEEMTDEEEEMTDEEELEDELIEDDIDMTDKPHKKSAFLDEEAEESNQESLSVKEGYEEESNELEEEIENHINDTENTNKKKELKRIIKPADDSDDEDLLHCSPEVVKSNLHLDSTVTADEDEIPPHQPPQQRTPVRPEPSQTKSITDFLTPISFITSIQNLSSKGHKDGSIVSPFRMPSDLKSPIRSEQEYFFAEPADESQDTLQPQTQNSTQISKESTNIEVESTYEDTPTTQDLLGICSGQFTGITQPEPTTSFEESQNDEVKSLDVEEMVISQLLNEEELERFKKKFESPITEDRLAVEDNQIGTTEMVGGGVIDSDDEEECKRRKGKNQKRIQFSDDESSSEDVEEKIDLQDDVDYVGYDSEENEIDLKANEKVPREKLNMADFLDAEAELSESEWGSEDEDEKGLDELEFELGDADNLDEKKIKSDLEKIHLRRMLDDDTREVKLLQELLLEDGEMHGAGRQRQFKWKNIDLNGDQTEERKDEDDIYLDEEESEEQWRKQRHQREMYLKKQQEKSRGQDLLQSSQFLKIGQKILQRSVSLNSQHNEKTETSPDKSLIFNLQNKRGSFLNRSDQVLQRVAEYTAAEIQVDSSKKTTKHFLFQSVSMSEVTMASAQNKKRKALDSTPNVLKKLRLSTNLSPAVKKKLDKPQKSKKLFD